MRRDGADARILSGDYDARESFCGKIRERIVTKIWTPACRAEAEKGLMSVRSGEIRTFRQGHPPLKAAAAKSCGQMEGAGEYGEAFRPPKGKAPEPEC